ncbi:acyl-CoA N-acyltransferase [Auriscalpium vulgare]|uniref:Acyl-CoA N-acyltransferase n=1 Tax=Auriscalpium vulgare TaxID=40419 RepID=A0ACB8RBV8_9AGAM|nr:acyl-CoA N-acyltransferase [Auriscalpium vulgare]
MATTTPWQSSRLTYREFRPSDVDDILSLFNDAETQRNVTADYIVPRSEGFRSQISRWGTETLLFVVVVDTATCKFVGQTSLRREGPPSIKNRDADLGMILAREWWGKGYGREVLEWTLKYGFRALALHRVSLTVLQGNKRAVSLYEKSGFVHEGARRKANWVDGAWEDVINMGMLEEDYFAAEAQRAKT